MNASVPPQSASDGANRAARDMPSGGDGAQRPTWRFLRAHPLHLIALGLGSGMPRIAPGTCGTLFAWGSFVVLDGWLSDAGWGAVIGAALVLGAVAAQRTGERLGRADSGHIVIDEIVAFWIVLVMLPDTAAHPVLQQAVAFVLFRLIDIAKPPPIRTLDARFKSGFGVMADDLVAAFYTLVAFALWYRLA
ncbi:MAG: phosphatidylglycerophosphatase A [Burkholderiaceae bacterium]